MSKATYYLLQPIWSLSYVTMHAHQLYLQEFYLKENVI
jgi:hypothetical protein